MKNICLVSYLLLSLPIIAFSQEELKETYAKIDSLEKVLTTLPADTSRLTVLFDLAMAHSNILEDSLFMVYANAHLKIAKDFNHTKGLDAAYVELLSGYIYSYPDIFEKTVIDARAYFIENRDTTKLLMLMVNEWYHEGVNKHDFQKAIRMIEAADSLNGTLKNAEIQEWIYTDLSDFMERIGDHKATIEYANKVLQQDTFFNISNKARALFFKGGALLSLDQLDSVETLLQTSINHFYEEEDFFNVQQVYGSLGDYYFKIKAIEKTRKVYKKIESLAKLNNCACTPLSGNYLQMGIYFFDLVQYDSAEIYLQKSIKQGLFERQYEPVLAYETSEAYALLSKIYEEKGGYREALQHYKQYKILGDSLKKNDNNKTLKEFNVKYETKEREKEITLLNKDKELLEARNQNYLIDATGIGLLTLLSLGFLFNFRRKNQKITQQKLALEQLNITKDRLFAIIGHDLRKPALAFRGIARKINYLVEANDKKRINQLGASLEQSVLDLNNLLDNILKWALNQKNAIAYNYKPVVIEPVIAEIMALFDQPIQQKKLQVMMDIEANQSFLSDRNILLTIIRNILDNAIKFSPISGKIRIQAEETEENLLLKIRDFGVGMSEMQVQRIFQLDNNKSRQGTEGEKGTGIGMVLVKELIELIHGKIQINSQVNEGTTVALWFPKTVAT